MNLFTIFISQFHSLENTRFLSYNKNSTVMNTKANFDELQKKNKKQLGSHGTIKGDVHV